MSLTGGQSDNKSGSRRRTCNNSIPTTESTSSLINDCHQTPAPKSNGMTSQHGETTLTMRKYENEINNHHQIKMSLSELPLLPNAFETSLNEELLDISDKVQKLAGMTENLNRLIPMVNNELDKENTEANLECDQLVDRSNAQHPFSQIRKLRQDVSEFADSLRLYQDQESNEEPKQKVETKELPDADFVPVMDEDISINDEQRDGDQTTMIMEQESKDDAENEQIVGSDHDNIDLQQDAQTADSSKDDLSNSTVSTITSDNDETLSDKTLTESGSDQSFEEPATSSQTSLAQVDVKQHRPVDENVQENLNVFRSSDATRSKAGKRRKYSLPVEPRQSRRIRAMTPETQVVKGKSRQVRRSMRKGELPATLKDFVI